MSTRHDDLDAWKRQRTVTLAFELADSGQYGNFGDIAYALQFERGLSTAQALIDDPDMRRQLNERCANAREALLPEPAVFEEPAVPVAYEPPASSILRRAASALRRTGARAASLEPVNAGDLNSAAS